MYGHPSMIVEHAEAFRPACFFVTVTQIRQSLLEASCLAAIGMCDRRLRYAMARSGCAS